MRVLVVTHNSAEQSRGGTEHFASHLVAGLRRFVDCVLLARDLRPDERPGAPTFRRGASERDLLWAPVGFDDFMLRQSSVSARADFRELLSTLRPDLIHFQHYHGLGIDLLAEAKRALPGTPVVLTLHEFLPICHAGGQMVKRSDETLCDRAGPRECSACFPEHSPASFLEREIFVGSCLRSADLLLSPSEFLRTRFVEWGIEPDRIRVVDNGQPSGLVRLPASEDPRTVFGYFGQIHRGKGLHVLLEAARILVDDGFSGWRLEINGDTAFTPDDYRRSVMESVAGLAEHVRFLGSYEPRTQASRMARVDWVVVPSTWWENRPLVIQEAFRFGRPVICADIGGMAEAVRPPAGGLAFRVSDPYALAAAMRRAASTPGLWERTRDSIPDVPDIEETTARHLRIYEELLGSAATTPGRVLSCAR